MTNKLNIQTTTPVSLCLRELLNRSTHLRFKKKSLFYTVGSEVDQASGATQHSAATGQLFGFDTSKTSHHGFIRIRDKSTRILSDTAVVQEAGEAPPFDSFDWRTIIFFRFPMDLNIPEIEGYVPGLGWTSVNLRNRRFWSAAPTSTEGIQEFNNLMLILTKVRYERNLVKRERDNGKKRKFMDDVTSIEGKWNSRRFVYAKTNGETDKLFDIETGEEVKKIRHLQENKQISLDGDFGDLNVDPIPRAESPQDVANLAARFEVLGEVERGLVRSIRETELGLIEDFMIGTNTASLEDIKNKTIEYGNVTYTIKLGDDHSYDYPEGTVERWKNGELEMRTVETRSQWGANEIGAMSSVNNLETVDV